MDGCEVVHIYGEQSLAVGETAHVPINLCLIYEVPRDKGGLRDPPLEWPSRSRRVHGLWPIAENDLALRVTEK